MLDPEGNQSVHKDGRQIYISDDSPPQVLPKHILCKKDHFTNLQSNKVLLDLPSSS